MNRFKLLMVICFFLIAAPCLVSASDTKIMLEMEYKVADGRIVKKSFGTLNISTLNKRGLWIVFRTEENKGFPGIVFGGNLIFCNDPIERMDSLEFVITVINDKNKITKRSVLFSKTRPMGSKAAMHNNIYHLLVLDDFVDKKSLPNSLGQKVTSYEPWKAAFFRTHRLAMNYAVQSDEHTRKYEKAFGVKTRYNSPRVILAAEEWLDIPGEVLISAKEKSGGFFGKKLGEVSEASSGKKKIVPKKIPIYSIDVLFDDIEAKGKFPIGFQVARSVRNDILEGEILFHATGSKRRIITAATVFSQMQKNIISKNSDNRLIAVNKNNTSALNKCEHLWPSVRKGIADFLKKNPEWKVIISEKPVIFYSANEPAYALYAWYQVHPQTGRMTGVLPNGTRGAFSDELANIEKGLLNKLKKKTPIKTKGGSVKALFSQVAGMYVSSAGVVDAVGLTICDPSLADLNEKGWIKFLTDHSLYFCQKFLEDNANLYDFYSSQIGFWQGAMFITYELGSTQAARECAYKAYKSITDTAIEDTKNYMENTFKVVKKSLNKKGRKALDNGLGERAANLNKSLKAIEEIKQYHDNGAEWGKKTAESVNQYNAALDDLKKKFKKKGSF
jgi:hypothetical protein